MALSSWIPKIFSRATPVDIVNQIRRAFSFSAGVVVNEDSSMQVAAYHRGLVYLSSQISKLPWEVKDRKNNVLYDDPVTFLMNVSPNGEMTAMMFRLVMMQNAINFGNGFAEIERDLAGRPRALWPLDPRRVYPMRDANGKLYYRVTGGNMSSGSDVNLYPRDMFHIRNFHTKDGIMGQGIVGYARQVLGISISADKLAGNLFANGGLPSGVLEVKGAMDDDAFKRLKDSWAEQHGGENKGGTAILEEGVTYKPVSLDPEAMQMLESRRFGVLEIARFLGVPPTKLFDTTASTFNNIENANLEVATDTIDAWARAFEGEADMKLLSNQFGGKFTEMDLYEIFRGDMKTRADYFSKMMQNAAMTPNEMRLKEGMSPYDGGDRFMLAVNNYSPMDRVDEIIDAQVAPKEVSAPSPTDAQLANAAIDVLTRG